jgi:hypothetical protein
VCVNASKLRADSPTWRKASPGNKEGSRTEGNRGATQMYESG